jgi:hypothetical protein
MSHNELSAHVVRYCAATGIGPIAVVMRKNGKPVQLLHHGLCDLPGKIRSSSSSTLYKTA